eukprot:TRINITY_DN10445_c0_g1_i2.p1 TRINITY_DN10445_c0_g1~~TRINITY_DN10445_c0_g1_i2.p1  ORF type:complete len:1417 (-),score=305.60 TRINITY_DN10445_c0_g1_i2:420-4670(-)
MASGVGAVLLLTALSCFSYVDAAQVRGAESHRRAGATTTTTTSVTTTTTTTTGSSKCRAPNESPPACPPRTYSSKSTHGYCYYAERDIMISTYFLAAEDWCSVENKGKAGAADHFELGGHKVWFRKAGKEANCCNESPVPSKCPAPADPKLNCPPGTYPSKSTVGYCYSAEKNQMVSTYFLESTDYCPEEWRGKSKAEGGRLPFELNGVRVWMRATGKETNCCLDTPQKTVCPNVTETHQGCPPGTFASKTKLGYCYDSAKNQMVSTYFNKVQDWCVEYQIGNKAAGNGPYFIGTTKVWKRSAGRETNCCESTAVPKSCPLKADARTACPPGTYRHRNITGYCYYPGYRMMISTWYEPPTDWCAEEKKGNATGNESFVLSGTNVWFKKFGMEHECCEDKLVPNPCPSLTDVRPACPVGSYASKTVPGYCYWPATNKMISTYWMKEYDFCPTTKFGKPGGGQPFQIAGMNVWERQPGLDQGCCHSRKVQDPCPEYVEGKNRPCPAGSYPHKTKQGYCYYSALDKMVTTYFNATINWCTEKQTGKKIYKGSFLINGSPVWEVKRGRDLDCCSSAIVQARCPPLTGMQPECPVGTFKSRTIKGYCYYPPRGEMVSTYYVAGQDWCAAENRGMNASGTAPYTINGVTVWTRQKEMEPNCCYNRPVADPCPKESGVYDPCPPGSFKSKTKHGFCYAPGLGMISTYFKPETDWCPAKGIGKIFGIQPTLFSGKSVWVRSTEKIKGCCDETPQPDPCPLIKRAPTCPPGSYAATKWGYCYIPSKDEMVTTYWTEADWCGESFRGNSSGKASYKVHGWNVWTRRKGKDATICCGKHPMPNACPFKNDPRVPCPAGTYPAKGKTENYTEVVNGVSVTKTRNTTEHIGYCYDPKTNRMISTWHEPQTDWCVEKSTVNAGKGDSWKIGNVNVWARKAGKEANCCEDKTVESLCPLRNQTSNPGCPPGTFSSKSIRGYCYDPVKNQMVSTFFVPKTDSCPNTGAGAPHGQHPRTMSGINVWVRAYGKDTRPKYGCCAGLQVQRACPSIKEAPTCPPGTLAATNMTGLCYDPQRYQMVNTYFDPQKNYCPDLNVGLTNNSRPYKIYGLNVWVRQYGMIPNCCGKEIRQIPCRKANETRLACPPATYPSTDPTKVGICFDPYKNRTVSTFMNDTEDWCDQGDIQAKNAVDPKSEFKLNGVTVWLRSVGKLNTTNFATVTVPDYCPELQNDRTHIPPCPEGTYPSKIKAGYCYDGEKGQMVSTFYNPSIDFCQQSQKGNRAAPPQYAISGQTVWFRMSGLHKDCCYTTKMQNPCPLLTDKRVACPAGTWKSKYQEGYCFDPKLRQMVSTYLNVTEDWCWEKLLGDPDHGRKPYVINGVKVFMRKLGFEDGCCNIPAGVDLDKLTGYVPWHKSKLAVLRSKVGTRVASGILR